jgi:hypothetical protein
MIIALDKLMNIGGNRYMFTKAVLTAIDRKDNIQNYPHEDRGWKVVPHVLRMTLDDEIKFLVKEKEEVKEPEKTEE